METRASDLSFTIPPAELSRIDAEIEPVVSTFSMADVRQVADESEEDAHQEMSQEQTYQDAIPPSTVAAIKESFDYQINDFKVLNLWF